MNAQYFSTITLGSPPQEVRIDMKASNKILIKELQFKVVLDTG